MSDASTRGARWRAGSAEALLGLGLVVAFVPALAADEGFVRVTHVWHVDGRDEWIEIMGRGYLSRPGVTELYPGTTAEMLIRWETGWAPLAISLAIAPLLFAWWRIAGVAFVRIAGIACAVAAGASAFALVAGMRGVSDLPDGVWWTVPVGGALMAAAFLVAPPPRVRDE